MKQNQKFFSLIESRIQSNGELYGRFHLGNFGGGQALTVANALRRTLLAEIPGIGLTNVQIEGVQHEFSTLPGVQENVLNILLNLKKIAITLEPARILRFEDNRQEIFACLDVSGPKTVYAKDIKFPAGIQPVCPNFPIATLGVNGKLKLKLTIKFLDPLNKNLILPLVDTGKNQVFNLNSDANPVRNVNFSIREIKDQTSQEYISVEILTNGSLNPQSSLDYALEQLTKTFYTFSNLVEQKFPQQQKIFH